MNEDLIKERQDFINKMKEDIYNAAISCRLPGLKEFNRYYNKIMDEINKLDVKSNSFKNKADLVESNVKLFVEYCAKLETYFEEMEKRRDEVFNKIHDMFQVVGRIKKPFPYHVDAINRYREEYSCIEKEYTNLIELRNFELRVLIDSKIRQLEVDCDLFTERYGEHIATLTNIYIPVENWEKDVEEEQKRKASESEGKRSK